MSLWSALGRALFPPPPEVPDVRREPDERVESAKREAFQAVERVRGPQQAEVTGVVSRLRSIRQENHLGPAIAATMLPRNRKA